MDNSFTGQLASALNKSVEGGAPEKKGLVAKSMTEVLVENAGSNANNVFVKSILGQFKSLGTVDVSALRIVSLSDRVAVQKNRETRFRDFLLAHGAAKKITDYQYRIIERNIVNNYSNPFNLDNPTLPANQQSQYVQRYNTLTAIGDTLQVSMLGQSMVAQQGMGDVWEQQVDDEVTRILKSQNRMLLSNVEVVAESAAQIPQLGGFCTRSTVAPISAAGGNLTNALIQQGYNQIADLYGYEQLALFTTRGQLAVIRDLMINRFPGENSATHLQLMNELYNSTLPSARGLQTPVVYQPYPGIAIPVYYDLDMPANTAILFKADFPRMASMSFDGATDASPMLVLRPFAGMFDYALVFALMTLDDPQVNSRVLFNNLAS